MTRIPILLVFLLLLFITALSSVQVTKTAKVPAGKTYVYLDENNKEVARKRSGQTAGTTGVTDCAEVPCPSTFDKNVVCWKCKKRPATKSQ